MLSNKKKHEEEGKTEKQLDKKGSDLGERRRETSEVEMESEGAGPGSIMYNQLGVPYPACACG